MAYGKSIELFLVNGTADSLITAELSNWNGKAIKIPRIEVASCTRDDITQAGVYFLFCREDDGSDSVYIGEAENVKERLVQHLHDYQSEKEKYYWNTAVIFVGRDLNKALIRYLENRFVEIARNCKRYIVLTKNTYRNTVMKESQIAVMEEFVDNVKEIDIKSNFRSDLLQYGTINNKLCAVPYMIGGYCKITYDNYDNLYVRKSNNEIVNQDNKIVVDDTQYQLYQNFISQKYDGILGTQRDFYRINNRINLGKMDNCNFEYISGYNDLIQYMAITSNVASEIQIAENFIEFILSEDGQIAIKDYGMFSVNISIYSSGEYKNFENEILKEINSVNAFVGRNDV